MAWMAWQSTRRGCGRGICLDSPRPIHLMFESILKWNPSNCGGSGSSSPSSSHLLSPSQSVSQCSVCLSIQGCAMVLWYWGCCGFNGNRNASDIVEQIKFFDEISFTRPHSQPHPHRHLPCNRSTGLSSEGERRRRKDGWICVVRFY